MLSTLWSANDSLLFTLGNSTGSIYLAAFAQLLVSYPAGRLRSRLERIIVGALYVAALSAALLPTFFETKPSCVNCPPNAFLVVDSHRTAELITGVFNVVGLVAFAGVLVVLALRWRRASAARRRVLAPVYVSGGAAAAFLGLAFAVSIATTLAGNVFWVIALVCFIALPFCFVYGLLRGRLSRAGVRMLLDAGGEASPSEAEAALRTALGDPSLRLAYWLEEERCYVDSQGEVLEPSAGDDGRLTTTIAYEGRPLAAIEYDASLSHEPELLEEVVAATRLTLEKDRGLQLLRLSEARGRALLSVLPDAMIRTNRDGVYLEVQGNRAGLVRPAEDLIGLSIRDTLPPGLVEPILACIDRTLATGRLQTLEYELDLDGERRSFEARMIPSGTDEVVSVVRDFTAERQLREELTARLEELEREQKFIATVVNTAPVILVLLDRAGRVVGLNTTCERLAGYDDATARGRPYWEVFVDPADHDAARELVAGLADDAPPVEHELRWRSRGGGELMVATCSTSILGADGTPHILLCGLDVTERERHLDEIRASRARIVEAGDAERRRLERNLHDGAQQRLVSLALALRLAQGRIATDPDGAGETLAAAGAELASALEELRELARGLHPAVLTDRGLEAALESLAERAALPVSVETELPERLPAAVEVARVLRRRGSAHERREVRRGDERTRSRRCRRRERDRRGERRRLRRRRRRGRVGAPGPRRPGGRARRAARDREPSGRGTSVRAVIPLAVAAPGDVTPTRTPVEA